MSNILVGDFDARSHRFALVAARFNEFIADKLVSGALDALTRHGADADKITQVRTPGSFEIPLAAKKLAELGRFDAIVCLGCIIRGQTPHFDYIAAEVSKGIAQVSLQSGVPISFGVITADSLEQAIDRAGGKGGNKGADAAMAAIEMANLLKAISK